MSFLFGDPGELYAIAGRISRHADAVRASASTLAAAVATDHWHGIASDVFAAEARSLTHSMRDCAARLDHAADALRRHARRVHAVVDEVKRVWHDVEHVATAVGHDVADVAASASSVVAGAVDALTPWG